MSDQGIPEANTWQIMCEACGWRGFQWTSRCGAPPIGSLVEFGEPEACPRCKLPALECLAWKEVGR